MGVASLNRRGLSGDWMIRGRGLEVTWQLSTNQNLYNRTGVFTLLILIHAAIWPQQIWAENWGLCPFGGVELDPHLTQCGQAEAYMHAKFHLDPSNRFATVHERHRQTGRRTDSIGRTVLQTVAQKASWTLWCYTAITRPSAIAEKIVPHASVHSLLMQHCNGIV